MTLPTLRQLTAALLAAFAAQATLAAPRVLFTDTPTAPTRGGENGAGGYLSIFGLDFGDPAGLGTTTRVFIGDHEVAGYRLKGPARVSGRLGVEEIVVQVGALGGAAAGTPLPVRVSVAGADSNTDQSFTPTTGRVLFVSLAGDDTSAAPDDPAHPWRFLQDAAHHRGAYYAMHAGDQVVLRGGHWTDTTGVDGTWMRASSNGDARNGRARAWIHVTSYPGEDVHYSTPGGTSGGIAGPWSDITGTSGNYWAVSNLRMDVAANANADAAPINLQYTTGPWRVVNNELGPWPVAGVPAAKAAGISGEGRGVVLLGNHVHDIAGTAALENHGVYIDTAATNWEIAWNWVHDITGGSLLQFYDSEGGAGTLVLPDGSTWPGFTGMRVHHNWLEHAAKYGITVADPGDYAGQVELRAWNNVIAGTALPPVRFNATALAFDVTLAYNTIQDAMTTFSGTGNGYFRNEGLGDGVIRVEDNLLAFGPHTVANTAWFYDYSGQGTGWHFTGNLYWDLGRGVPPPHDATAVRGDPLFTDAAHDDLTLRAGSPAIDAAHVRTPMPVPDDLTGRVRRPSGPANDLGAYERPQ